MPAVTKTCVFGSADVSGVPLQGLVDRLRIFPDPAGKRLAQYEDLIQFLGADLVKLFGGDLVVKVNQAEESIAADIKPGAPDDQAFLAIKRNVS